VCPTCQHIRVDAPTRRSASTLTLHTTSNMPAHQRGNINPPGTPRRLAVGVGTLVCRRLGALARGCVGVLHVGEWARTVRWHVDRWVCSSWRVVVWACRRVGVCVGASSSHWCVGVSAHWCGCVGGLVHQFSTGATWHWCMVGNINEFLIGHGTHGTMKALANLHWQQLRSWSGPSLGPGPDL